MSLLSACPLSNDDDIQADRERALRQREYLAQLEEDSEEPTSLATTTEGEHTVQVIENTLWGERVHPHSWRCPPALPPPPRESTLYR